MHRFGVERLRPVRVQRGARQVVGPDLIAPLVDGRRFGASLATALPGIEVDLLLPPSTQWLGQPVHGAGGRAVVLEGACGVAECCGVLARITVHADRVVWEDLVAPDALALAEGARFTFERRRYEAALARIHRLVATDWPVPSA